MERIKKDGNDVKDYISELAIYAVKPQTTKENTKKCLKV